MKSHEFMNEAVLKGTFGSADQVQQGEEVPLSNVFGSEGYNLLSAVGIKLEEKPGSWSYLEQKMLGKEGYVRIKSAFKQGGIELKEYPAWQIFDVEDDDSDSYVRGPSQLHIQIPDEKVFVIFDLPFTDDRRGRNIQTGTFIVDTSGADTYIRFWRRIL